MLKEHKRTQSQKRTHKRITEQRALMKDKQSTQFHALNSLLMGESCTNLQSDLIGGTNPPPTDYLRILLQSRRTFLLHVQFKTNKITHIEPYLCDSTS